MDLIIFDCQENLSILLISEKDVPTWNSDPTCVECISVCGGQCTRQWLCSCISLLQPSVAPYVCGTAERLQEVGDEEKVAGIQPIGPSVRYYIWSNSKFSLVYNAVVN